MDVRITAYFDNLEQRLIDSNAVSQYTVLRSEVTLSDGKMRVRALLRDGGLLELFEYVTINRNGDIVRLKYSYHWQDMDGQLVRRWDAVHHYLHLPHAPHHVHLPDGSVEGVVRPPDMVAVLTQIEAQLA